MRRWLNPWPAISDLFSGLLVASFAGLVMFTGITRVEQVAEQKVRKRADDIKAAVLRSLQTVFTGETRSCGVEDVCFDIHITFSRDSDEISQEDVFRLREVCGLLKEAIRPYRHEVQIVIEGHSDSVKPRNAKTPRFHFVYNWNLSSQRATSVLYELSRCGLNAPNYKVIALGYADSDPLCDERTLRGEKLEACRQQNRRTTFRIRPDKAEIRKRVVPSATPGHGSAP